MMASPTNMHGLLSKDFAVYPGEFMTPQDVVGFTTRALNHLRTSRPTAVNLFNMADAYVMPIMRFWLVFLDHKPFLPFFYAQSLSFSFFFLRNHRCIITQTRLTAVAEATASAPNATADTYVRKKKPFHCSH
jgi:hypothetical protein